MAEKPSPVSETVLELEQEVTCAICHDHYQEPKLLPCCHYYCKQCILSLSSRYPPDQPFPCPDCREPTLLPGNDPDKLPTAFFITRMKDLHSRMEKAQGKLEALCEMCTGGEVTAFCRQCVHFICNECSKSHQRMRMFAGHTVSDLDELKRGGVKAFPVVDIPAPKCTDHGEPEKIFCFDCKRLICRDCVIFDHRDHESEFVKKAASETRKKLAEHLSPLKNLMPGLSSAMNRVRETKQKVQAQGELVEKQVNDEFQKLHDILEQSKARVLKESSDISERKMENLTVQEKDLDLSVGSMQSLVDFVERRLENASDGELIAMQEQVLSRMDVEAVKREKEAVSADPAEKADFGVEVLISEDLKKLCENGIVTYEGNTIRGDITLAQVDKPTKFTLFIPRGSDQQEPPVIEITLTSPANQTSPPLEAIPVKGSRGGTYSINYVPKVHGPHRLLISVNGQPITGSPFPVFVQPSKPVRNTHINSPVHIASNSSGEMLVTDYGQDVVILDELGEKLRSISKSKHRTGQVCGVAVDKDDNIYVSDALLHCVYKFNKSGEDLLKKLGGEGEGPGEFNFPRGLAVAGDRVYVCDRRNHRVQVLTTELEPVFQFGSKGAGDGQLTQPESIAVDSEESVFVADSHNQRIQVFARDGKFIRSISKKENQGVIGFPQGVCVDGDYVHVRC